MNKKTILHLCASVGSWSREYQIDDEYEVIIIGKEIGVENYHHDGEVHGVFANPVCTQLSMARGREGDLKEGMFLVNHCLRIIKETNPKWWALENPATGKLKDLIGAPKFTYQPWEYGSPWTKKTAVWGNFNIPNKTHKKWEDVSKNPNLYTRPGRPKCSLAFLHKSAINYMPEYEWCKDRIHTDMDLRSLCCPGFAKAFKEVNE